MNHDEFTTELHHVVVQARDTGVPLDGAYNVRSPHHDIPDYTIEITEITKRSFGVEGMIDDLKD